MDAKDNRFYREPSAVVDERIARVDASLAKQLQASIERNGRMVVALRAIAAMDPDGVRADDLGRAAKLAREGLV